MTTRKMPQLQLFTLTFLLALFTTDCLTLQVVDDGLKSIKEEKISDAGEGFETIRFNFSSPELSADKRGIAMYL